MHLPTSGMSVDQVNAAVNEALSHDADWKGGRIWSLVYYAGDDVAQVLRDSYSAAIYTNGLGPGAFKSLKKFESEIIAITAGLLGDRRATGNMTSGGTESIMMALKTARDWARETKGITEPEVIIPDTAHPAFHKAAQYLQVKTVVTPIDADLRADLAAVRDALTPATVLIVGSAPNYPFGTIDDIPALGEIAQQHGIGVHVDACLGGFLLPFVEKLGYDVPPWDFSVPGVVSISADLHKYGFAARGASTVMYRDKSYRRHQFFAYSDWPGGLYGSPTLAGSRPGGAIAASWAVLHHLGEEGYTRLARVIMDTTKALQDGINAIDGLHVIGDPAMSVFSFTGEGLDIYAVGDAMDNLGWHPDRQQRPPSLHLMVTPTHSAIVQPFLADLRTAADSVRSGEVKDSGRAAMYGMLDSTPDRSVVRNVILDFVDRMTERPAEGGQDA